jgi:hypothetical protein
MKIETTDRVHGMLSQGGICGRIRQYTNKVIADIMDCSPSEAADMDGDEIVPAIGITLREYVSVHNIPGRTICRGVKIE